MSRSGDDGSVRRRVGLIVGGTALGIAVANAAIGEVEAGLHLGGLSLLVLLLSVVPHRAASPATLADVAPSQILQVFVFGLVCAEEVAPVVTV